ncbi:beta-1,4-galactosyltransferase, putative [Ixodes scapularis]|uniref:Beta-1,4-galactosyltransferase, putative n=1 Tax=Ixodes scapularis TaxID=6945 RepID=B7PHF7_IXOSC|nr:beta-1,4-galactosyltransferase, putative [Ixodes scapularis]|eukprot:XP_002402759.1 beta-1,4-galactosyltransferase, putative [Ixodes scapularis]
MEILCEAKNRWKTVMQKKTKPAQGTYIPRFNEPNILIVIRPKTQARITDIQPSPFTSQYGNDTFNKGVLMNAGVREALRDADFQCFVFHDVDLIPEDDRNMYSCPPSPRHMSVAIDKFNYTINHKHMKIIRPPASVARYTMIKHIHRPESPDNIRLPYQMLVGGVFAIKREHFLKVNGFSNLYWGWGGEDDDMAYRINHKHMKIIRPPASVARYTMIKHIHRPESPDNIRLCPVAISRTDARRSEALSRGHPAYLTT